ncbi:MAG: recombinase family protein [Chloroflexi bacterium]|nr:recombinase family protein [Chloroflexota bacterium]
MNQQHIQTPVALYARVSSDRQDVDLSVAAQLRALRDYAERNGYSVAREYVDEAESGRIADRPQFRRMLDEAAKPEAPFKEILVWKFSRFTRKREHAVAFKSMLRRKGIRVVSITEHADDSPTGKLMEAIIESVDEFYSENLAEEVRRGMREAASRGFWVASRVPYGYRKLMVQDGAKKRPTLEPDPATSPVVKRIFDMAESGRGILDITRTLNGEGIANPTGRPWSKNGVHIILRNEAYTGTLLWGGGAKDKGEPVRVDKAFPAIVTKSQFRKVNKQMRSRAPRKAHPRRVGSSYLLSGLVKCKTCERAMSGQDSKSGQFAYYVCQSLMKRGSGACDCPRLNARRFEEMVVGKIRENVLTESNIRELVRLVDEEMDGIAREQRQRLETAEAELADVKRRLERLYNLAETTDLDIEDFKPRIRDHRERQQRLEETAEESRVLLSQRRVVLDDVETITAYCEDLSRYLNESELTERRAFIESFVREIVVQPGGALVRYSIPMPEDSPIGGRDSEELALHSPVLSTVKSGGPDWTKSRTEADSDVTPSCGMGMVYVRTASSSTISMPCTKLRINAFRSGNVPSWKSARKSATYPLISFDVGNSARRCSNWNSASSRAATSWSWRLFRVRMRGDKTSMGNCWVSSAW